MLNALFQHLDIPIPPSVVDAQEMSRAILEQHRRESQRQQTEDALPGNPRVNPMPSIYDEGNKIGSISASMMDNKEKLAAIRRYLKKIM